MKLKDIGLLLRTERERRGLSVKQVMEATKISRRNLTALEEGDRSILPHPVYTKGFVRNYARLLGLDEETLARAVDAEYGMDEEGEPVPMPSPARGKAIDTPLGPQAVEKKRSWPTMLSLLVLVGLLGILVASQYAGLGLNGIKPKPQAPESPAASQTEPAPAAVAPDLPSTPPSAEEPPHPAPAAAAPREIPAMQPSEPEPASSMPAETEAAAPQPEPAEPAKEPSVAAEVAKPAKHGVVVVTARQNQKCWVLAIIDGRDRQDHVVQNGESVRFEYGGKMSLKLGNAGGVVVAHNGKPVVIDAPAGTVKSLQFP